MPGIGEVLLKAREVKGISIRDAEEATKIRFKYLQALEQENFDQIPGRVYAIGFLRTYSRFLGLNTEELTQAFKGQYEEVPIDEVVREQQPPQARSTRRRRKNYYTLVLAVAALLTLYLVNWSYQHYLPDAQTITENNKGTTDSGDREQSSDQPGQPAPNTGGHGDQNGVLPGDSSTASGPGTGQPQLDIPPGQVAIQLVGREKSWISVRVDGQTAFSGFLTPGNTTQTFLGARIYLVTGNAGGTEVILNGKSLGLLGDSADVVKREFTASGSNNLNETSGANSANTGSNIGTTGG